MTKDFVLKAQGFFYVSTGLWALLHMRSFEAVTGPKTDRWLVKTVGALVLVAGSVMAAAGLRKRAGFEAVALAAGSAAALTMVDVVYAAKRRISPIYLADALVELLFVAGLVFANPPMGAPDRYDERH